MANRAAQQDDTLIVDFTIRERDTGKTLPGLEGEKFELDTANPEGFIPGVVPLILGMKVGEQKHIDFTFPEQWEPAELAGKDATVRPVAQFMCCMPVRCLAITALLHMWSAP